MCHKTFVALRPINSTWGGTGSVAAGKGKVLLSAATGRGNGGPLAGFALEIGEGDYDKFVAGVLAKGKLTVNGLEAELTGSDGSKVKMICSAVKPDLWRNGTKHDWQKHFAVCQTTTEGAAKISLGCNCKSKPAAKSSTPNSPTTANTPSSTGSVQSPRTVKQPTPPTKCAVFWKDRTKPRDHRAPPRASDRTAVGRHARCRTAIP